MKTFDVDSDVLDYDFLYNPEETAFLQKHMKDKSDLSLDDIRRMALWKLDRVIDVSDETLEHLHKVAKDDSITIQSELVFDTLKRLTNSSGIGFPMASAILKFLRPDIFPIIDVRAYRALYGKKIYSSQYSIEKYIDYVKKLYEISEKLQIELKDVDEQLYCYDKKYNGKI